MTMFMLKENLEKVKALLKSLLLGDFIELYKV